MRAQRDESCESPNGGTEVCEGHRRTCEVERLEHLRMRERGDVLTDAYERLQGGEHLWIWGKMKR
jgi:hypothetical protein